MTPVFAARCTIIGGANGSGKSSIFENARQLRSIGEFVNADLVARAISRENPESVSAEAGRKVIRRLHELVAHQDDFVFETTLASRQSLALMRAARDAEYHVGLLFVVLRDPELNVRRVHERVGRGGHSIPDDTIRRRYVRALGNLPSALVIAHEAAIYDNSSMGPEKLIEVSDRSIVFNNLDETDMLHRVIAGAIADALTISIDTAFRTAKS